MPDAIRRYKAEIFQALAHPTRIAMLELLRDGELPAGQIIARLGLEQANVSQHLAVLRARGIVMNRKAGNQVFYSLRNPLLSKVLDIMRRFCQAHVAEARASLGVIQKQGANPKNSASHKHGPMQKHGAAGR